MDENSYLNPNNMISQCDGAINILKKDNDALRTANASLDGFINDGEIKSSAFDTLKQQINDYKMVTTAMAISNEYDIDDYETLKGSVGDEVLNGSDILTQKESARSSRENNESTAEAYRREAEIAGNPIFILGYTAKAQKYMYMAALDNDMYEKWVEKKKKYDDIENNTGKFFQNSESARAAAINGIESIRGAFQNGSYAPDMNAPWRQAFPDSVEEMEAKQELLRQGFNKAQLDHMSDLDYKYQDVLEAWNLCETEIDREFFKCLMTGTEADYKKAFAIDPYDLSDSMTIFMADYSCHLLELDKNKNSSKESEKRLMEFNNALLGSERYACDEYGNVLSITYRDIYLEKMYVGTRTLMEGDAFILASMSPNDPGYSKLYEEYKKRLAMTSLWSTEQLIVQALGQTNEYEDQQCSIVNLTFEYGEPGMDLKHYSPWNGNMVTEKISTNIARKGIELGGFLDAEAMKKAGKAQEKAFQNFICSIGTDVVIAAFAIYAPEVAIVLSLAAMAGNGSAGTVSGLDSHADSKLQKLGIGSANIAVAKGINSYISFMRAGEQLKAKGKEVHLRWFGMGGLYEVDGNGVLGGTKETLSSQSERMEGISFTGVYNPKVLRKMGKWESEGMTWVNWGGDNTTCQNVIDEIEDDKQMKKGEPQLWQDCITLIKGKEGMFETMGPERFQKAINEINKRTYISEEEKADADLHQQFVNWAGGDYE